MKPLQLARLFYFCRGGLTSFREIQISFKKNSFIATDVNAGRNKTYLTTEFDSGLLWTDSI